MTPEQLRQVMPYAKDRAELYATPLADACQEFSINTPQREAAFIAQVAHESGELLYTREIASGAAYEGRRDLGNLQAGDGVRFKGRGLIQITGRFNYALCASVIGLDLIANPLLLEVLPGATRSAGWYWKRHGLNKLADVDDLTEITRRINGGLTHLDDRRMYWQRARRALEIA